MKRNEIWMIIVRNIFDCQKKKKKISLVIKHCINNKYERLR